MKQIQGAKDMAQKATNAVKDLDRKAKDLVIKVNTPPPPPRVFGGIVLKRTPALTPEDEPAVPGSQKFCMKLFLVPLALVAWLYGCIAWMLLELMRCFLLPCLGPLFVQMMAAAVLARDQAAVKDMGGCGYSIVKWWVGTYWWVMRQCMAPLFSIWSW
ncbi:hypothetical protein T492DRAFT_911543 [Pavlovales sp. CCMP2436]|nr:hypothetical protein T492DRAFT_911543 [Pavlovales sp. CCMP2436]